MPNDLHVKAVLEKRFGNEIKNGHWSKIAKILKVNRGLLWRVYHGKTKSNRLRAALKLKCVMKKVRPCPCGKIHIEKECKQGKMILQRLKSSDPQTLKFIQETIVPFLINKLKEKNEQT